MANSSLIEKFENISKMLNKDIKQGESNFANATLDELNEWKRIVETVISKPGFDPNNQNHVNVRNNAERCLRAINKSIELRKQNYPVEEKIEKISNEVNKLRLKIDNLKKDLESGLKSLSEYNDLVQGLVEEYKVLFEFAEGVFNSINEKFSEIRIDKRGDITRLRESLISIKRDIVILKNWLIDAYNDKAYAYNEEFHDLVVTDEEKKQYNLPSEIDFISRIQRYDNESFYNKTDISKLVEAISNLNKLKNDRIGKKESIHESEKVEEKKESIKSTVSYDDVINSIVAINPDMEIYRDRNNIYINDDFNSLRLPYNLNLEKSGDRATIVDKETGIRIGLYNAKNYSMAIKTGNIVRVRESNEEQNVTVKQSIVEHKSERIKEEKKTIREERKKLIVKKVKNATNFYKKHRKFILYSAGLTSIAIAGLSASSLIAPAIIFGNAIFINKNPKYKPAIDVENERLGNIKLSEEEVINNLNEATVKCAKSKEEALNIRNKIVLLGRKIKESISKFNDNLDNFNEENMATGRSR